MPVHVVDLLEVVDVDRRETRRLVDQGAHLDGAGELPLEHAPVPELRERVDVRLPASVLELDFEDVDALSELACQLELSCALLIDDLREPLDSLERGRLQLRRGAAGRCT